MRTSCSQSLLPLEDPSSSVFRDLEATEANQRRGFVIQRSMEVALSIAPNALFLVLKTEAFFRLIWTHFYLLCHCAVCTAHVIKLEEVTRRIHLRIHVMERSMLLFPLFCSLESHCRSELIRCWRFGIVHFANEICLRLPIVSVPSYTLREATDETGVVHVVEDVNEQLQRILLSRKNLSASENRTSVFDQLNGHQWCRLTCQLNPRRSRPLSRVSVNESPRKSPASLTHLPLRPSKPSFEEARKHAAPRIMQCTAHEYGKRMVASKPLSTNRKERPPPHRSPCLLVNTDSSLRALAVPTVSCPSPKSTRAVDDVLWTPFHDLDGAWNWSMESLFDFFSIVPAFVWVRSLSPTIL